MEKSNKILSDIIVYMKYSKYLPHLKRRETWEEIVDRNKQMHIKKFPQLKEEIDQAYQFVMDKKVLPSMRSLQFAGTPIELNPARLYNCSFLPVDHPDAFSEIMFLLLSGTGVGYSVQTHHIEKLPEIVRSRKTKRYLVGDSIEGWADAVKILVNAYFYNKPIPNFDFRDIRPKGARLITSGGKAPGSEGLKTSLFQIQKILDRKNDGDKLTSLEVHDICCFIADAVLSGGIRRSAMISLFDLDDEDMLSCKFGNWSETEPQRARANNTAVVLRHKIDKATFLELWKKIELSNSGEPGFMMSNDKEWGLNPSLRAGTKVLTTNGIFSIEQLENKTFYVKNLYGEISPAKCWLSGKNKQLYKITLSCGKEYYATPEHKWPVVEKKGIRKINSNELKKGQYLPILSETKLFNGNLGDYNDGFLCGWLYGDGWITKRKDTGAVQYGICVGKNDAINGIFNKLKSIVSNKISSEIHWTERPSTFETNFQRKSADNYFKSFGVSHKSNGLPTKIWTDCSEEYRKGFIDGLISSDGNIDTSTIGKFRINFTTKHKKLADDFSELLGFYGILSSVCYRKSVGKRTFPNGNSYFGDYSYYTVRINDKNSIYHFSNIICLSHNSKQNKFEKLDKTYFPSKSRMVRIKSVELSNIYEDVWDISVYDNSHCFQLSHCITGNCGEISLRSFQFCNLTTINASTVENQEDLNERAKAASFIGTLQASYTDFHYLRDAWKKTTEKEALIGVSMTGIASGKVLKLNLEEASNIVKEENARVAKLIGINKSSRCTTVKPEGTTSIVLGSSSGIHAWHSKYYWRRVRVGKNEEIYKYLAKNNPELIEDEYFKPHLQAVISVPQKAPDDAITRNENALDLLNRVSKVWNAWVKNGHRKGSNVNNVSTTVSIKKDEWKEVGDWLWKYREEYTAISVLPFDENEHTYVQSPFEEITEQQFNKAYKKLEEVDLSKIIEEEDDTKLQEELACSGGACDIR